MTIFNVPIESLEERYSQQWNEWFPLQFDFYNVKYENIYPDTLTDKIRDGSFLDVCGTNYFKAGQLKILCQKLFNGEIRNKDVIFFHDLWFPGLEMLQYIRQGMGIDFKICGILHAGTYDPYDFISKKGMEPWGHLLEDSWFSFIDKIFVATRFHKKLILSSRNCSPDKIEVTGLPIYWPYEEVKDEEKENIIVFPHRKDSEKNPKLFIKMASKIYNSNLDICRNWTFVFTKDVCKNKKEYYELLRKARIAVSFADQETWGIAQQEALFAGCYPVVPNRLSYQELYFDDFKYETFDEAVDLVSQLIAPSSMQGFRLKKNRDILLSYGKEAIGNMLSIMEGL